MINTLGYPICSIFDGIAGKSRTRVCVIVALGRAGRRFARSCQAIFAPIGERLTAS